MLNFILNYIEELLATVIIIIMGTSIYKTWISELIWPTQYHNKKNYRYIKASTSKIRLFTLILPKLKGTKKYSLIFLKILWWFFFKYRL